jgi:DNA-binding response OmpR family regulator
MGHGTIIARQCGMPITSIPPRKRRILVVEDEIAARDALYRVLSLDYEVMVAGDGVEGAEVAAKTPPDLILSDVSMPRLDGFGMVRRIRAKLGRKVPVIFLTALDSPRAVIDGISAGARHYLTKPVSLTELERRVQRALGIS